MNLAFYQVDAFADRLFTGNPAGVVPLDAWIPDEMMQQIALENNLSETAFFVREEDSYRIRWFTPTSEVDLCGHATLSAAHVLFRHLDHPCGEVRFLSKSGILRVLCEDELLVLDFPADTVNPATIPMGLAEALGMPPLHCFKGKTDYLLVYPSEETILALQPEFHAIAELPVRGIIVTAPGKDVDFVSRFFAPAVGVDEDPVTGSAHTSLTPYWANRLGKTTLFARQLSKRTGSLRCMVAADRVFIAGKALTYLRGNLEV